MKKLITGFVSATLIMTSLVAQPLLQEQCVYVIERLDARELSLILKKGHIHCNGISLYEQCVEACFNQLDHISETISGGKHQQKAVKKLADQLYACFEVLLKHGVREAQLPGLLGEFVEEINAVKGCSKLSSVQKKMINKVFKSFVTSFNEACAPAGLFIHNTFEDPAEIAEIKADTCKKIIKLAAQYGVKPA